jgi:hypothetical protein
MLRAILDLSKHRDVQLRDAVAALAKTFGLSETDLSKRSGKTGDLVFAKNVRWGLTHLARAGLISRPKPGVFVTTGRGKEALTSSQTINFPFLKQYPEYQSFLDRPKLSSDRPRLTQYSTSADGSTQLSEPLEEEEDSDPDFKNPYDPKAIRVDPRVYSVRQLLDMIDEEEVDVVPDFQRLKVWKPWQRSQLIESLLLRIPLPTFYFSSDEDGLLQVVDGVQRLTTIHDFVRKNDFELEHLEYLQDAVGGKKFQDLEGSLWSRRILATQITAFVIDPQTPLRVKFDIFRRINTGGSPLNSQEIRHCLTRTRSRTFLKSLADSESFREATNGVFWNHRRMVDRELALRFVAFRLLPDVDIYELTGSMDEFLTNAAMSLDNPAAVDDESLERLKSGFDLAMKNAMAVFDGHAFRKWFAGGKPYPVNRALFDVWSVELSRYPRDVIARIAGPLKTRSQALLTDDLDFLEAVTTGTGSPAKVSTRFRKVQKIFKEVLA